MTTGIHQEYLHILERISNLCEVNDHEEYEAYKDRLQTLPGFPRGYDVDNDIIIPVIVNHSLSMR